MHKAIEMSRFLRGIGIFSYDNVAKGVIMSGPNAFFAILCYHFSNFSHFGSISFILSIFILHKTWYNVLPNQLFFQFWYHMLSKQSRISPYFS